VDRSSSRLIPFKLLALFLLLTVVNGFFVHLPIRKFKCLSTNTCASTCTSNHRCIADRRWQENHNRQRNRSTVRFLTRQEANERILKTGGLIAWSSFLGPSLPAIAEEGGFLADATPAPAPSAALTSNGSAIIQPFAPLEALLPAARLKLWMDEAYEMTSLLSGPSSTDKRKKDEIQICDTILRLNNLLSSPPKLFFQGERQQLKKSGGAGGGSMMGQMTSSVSSANKDQYQRNRKNLNVGDKFVAMLNQADVERQWGMLQYAESKREESNEMRAAFNFYTQQLNFNGDTYVLTASKQDRKDMIRNDALPSLTSVITSDLDLRELYRNQFLTAVEDVQAEVAYQAKQCQSSSSGGGEVDVLDVQELMMQAYTALSKWFSLIPQKDVQEAVEKLLFNADTVNEWNDTKSK